MFGYIKVDKGELLVREYEAYKSVYCGLCKQLGKDYSIFARLILSYDCTFYGLLILALNNCCDGFYQKRCVCNPLKKCTYCKTSSDSISKASALSVITSYYKIIDDIQDSNFAKRIILKIVKHLFLHWRKKAEKKYPVIDLAVKTMIEKQFEVENKESSILDEACEPTAEMMATILSLEGKDEKEKRILHQMGYGLGRFIYLADAVDDYKRDKEKGNYNPFNSIKENLYSIMSNNLSQALAITFDAYNLLEFVDFKGIIDNIIIKGLPKVQEDILKKVKGDL